MSRYPGNRRHPIRVPSIGIAVLPEPLKGFHKTDELCV